VDKVNFQYFLGRLEILNEARVSTLFGKDDELNNAYNFLRSYLKKKGYESSSSIDLAAFRYIFNIMDDYVPQEDLGIIPSFSANNIKKYVIPKLKEMLVSNKFKREDAISNFRDTNKIDEYVNFLKINSGNRSTQSKKSKENILNYSMEEYQELKNKLDPYIKKINHILGNKKRQKTKDDYEVLNFDDLPDDFYRSNILEFLDDLFDDIINSELERIEDGDEPSLEINIVKDIHEKIVKKRILENRPLSKEDFEKSMSTIKNLPQVKNNGVYMETIDFIMDAYHEEISNVEELDNPNNDIEKIYQELLNNNSNESLQRVVDKVIPTEELKTDFYTFLSMKEKIKSSQSDKLSSDMKNGIDKFWAKRNKDDSTNESPNNESSILKQMNSIEKQLETPNLDPALRKKLENKYMELANTEKDIVDKDKKDDIYERYMVERVKYDRQFKTEIPKFTERKFRKFHNYNHWLQVNSERGN
jgi:hypothetical protein